MKLIALIEDPDVIFKIHDHLGLPTEKPTARPARGPPQADLWDDVCIYDADAYAE